MASRNWNNLSDSYRSRLERNGISRSDYESGASLDKVRGHGATPEHPERAESNPERYKDYLGTRNQLINDIQRAKRELFDASGKFNNAHSKKYIKVDSASGHVRTKQQLQEILKIAKGLKDGTITWAQFQGNPDWDEYRSAFFYH